MAMTKEFNYRGYLFTIVVTLNKKIEKCIDGKRWHHVMIKTMNDGGDGFLETRDPEDAHLESTIVQLTGLAKEWVNAKLDGVQPEDKRLTDLGFKND